MVVLIFVTVISVLILLFLNSISCMLSYVSLKSVPQVSTQGLAGLSRYLWEGKAGPLTAHDVRDLLGYVELKRQFSSGSWIG